MSSKKRILEHMNKDHLVSLYDYLGYYEGIGLDVANPQHSVELVDVTLDHLTINYFKNGTSKTVNVPINPPMSNLGQARVRLVQMAFESADALQVSPYQIKWFHWPSKTHGGALAFLVISNALAALNPDYAAHLLEPLAPALARFVKQRARRIFALTLVTHALEYVVFLKAKLNKHRVLGSTRLKWILMTMLVGYPSWVQFDREANKLKLARIQFEAEHSKK